MSDLAIVLLAAGKGTRMRSATPKLLHEAAGRPVGLYAVEAALRLRPSRLVVVTGHGREALEAAIRKAMPRAPIVFAGQREQRGTGHALRCGLAKVPRSATRILVACGDTPLLPAAPLRALAAVQRRSRCAAALLTCVVSDAAMYGRIVRDGRGSVARIVEHRDASARERAIREINPAVYVFDAAFLRRAIRGLRAANAQREFYLTDLLEAAARTRAGVRDAGAPFDDLRGVNTREELVEVEEVLLDRIRRGWMRKGVTIRSPGTVRIDAGVAIGDDVEIGPAAQLLGATRIAGGARIGAGSILRDVTVGPGAEILPYVVATRSEIRAGARIGPFTHLRPESVIGRGAHLGNFVETKKTTLLDGAKANHLAYLGDGVVGRRSNVGAGTIFCNYDGFSKHLTVIGDDVFVGSDSQLVAPVRVGDRAYVASGSTVVSDVPADALAVARGRQENKEGYAKALRRRLRRSRR